MRSLDNSFFHAILELKQLSIHSHDKRAADFWASLVASRGAFVDRSSVHCTPFAGDDRVIWQQKVRIFV